MLSIVIPTLNEEDYLLFLLDSIKKQDFKNYEIIVADAGSKDRTIEIAKKYGCRIVSGGLPGKGRNEGAKAAEGELILFLDADLVLPEAFLSDFICEFEEKKLDIASTDLEFLSDKVKYKIAAKLCNFYYWATQRFFPYITECILVKKDMHQKAGGFAEEIKLLEDFDYVRRAARVGKFGHLKSIKFYTSPRRFEKDGLARVLLKYLLANFYALVFGPIKTNIFKYNFSHYSFKKNNNKV